MLLSMTGYGRATLERAGKSLTVELRSLNSKQNDLRVRTNVQLHKYELQLRRLVLDVVKRGKLELTVEVTDETGGGAIRVNTALLNNLYLDVLNQARVGDEDKGFSIRIAGRNAPFAVEHLAGLYPALLRVPGIVEAGNNRLADEDWKLLAETAEAAVADLNRYRHQEGQVLARDLAANCQRIADLLTEVGQHEGERVTSVRDRMERHLEEYLGHGKVDKNRYEQEVLFYLEKMDINEEKVRLRQNCDYFLEILGNDDRVKGRKLNFISQEIGREVNTLGAKAYSAGIQRLVVNMKEQLEMIKEQLANVA